MSAATTSAMAPHDAIEAALATGLAVTDTSRRVGWARAYAALERCDSLEEHIRTLTDTLTAHRRAYSRLLGFANTIGVPRTAIFNAEMAAHYEAERTFRHTDAYDSGVSLAEQHNAEVRGEDVTRRAARRHRLRVLFSVAREAGHALQTSTDGEQWCTCGFHARRVADEDAIFEHAAQAAFGVPYAEWKRAFTGACPTCGVAP